MTDKSGANELGRLRELFGTQVGEDTAMKWGAEFDGLAFLARASLTARVANQLGRTVVLEGYVLPTKAAGQLLGSMAGEKSLPASDAPVVRVGLSEESFTKHPEVDVLKVIPFTHLKSKIFVPAPNITLDSIWRAAITPVHKV